MNLLLCFVSRKAKEKEKVQQTVSQMPPPDEKKESGDKGFADTKGFPDDSKDDSYEKQGNGSRPPAKKKRDDDTLEKDDHHYGDRERQMGDRDRSDRDRPRSISGRGGREFVRGRGRMRGPRGGSAGPRGAYRGARGGRDHYGGQGYERGPRSQSDHGGQGMGRWAAKSEEVDGTEGEVDYENKRRRGRDEESDVSVDEASGYSESSSERTSEAKESGATPNKEPEKDGKAAKEDQQRPMEKREPPRNPWNRNTASQQQQQQSRAGTPWAKDKDLNKDTVDNRDTQDPRRDNRDGRDIRDPRDDHSRDHRDPRDNRDNRGNRDVRRDERRERANRHEQRDHDADRMMGGRNDHGNGFDKMGHNDMAFVPRGEPSRRGRGTGKLMCVRVIEGSYNAYFHIAHFFGGSFSSSERNTEMWDAVVKVTARPCGNGLLSIRCGS